MYSGFELCEAAALPGREEYLDSEKYQIKVRDFDRPGNIVAEITKLNRIRKTHPALQRTTGLTFLNADNEQVLAYGKALPNPSDVIVVAVSLDGTRILFSGDYYDDLFAKAEAAGLKPEEFVSCYVPDPDGLS